MKNYIDLVVMMGVEPLFFVMQLFFQFRHHFSLSYAFIFSNCHVLDHSSLVVIFIFTM